MKRYQRKGSKALWVTIATLFCTLLFFTLDSAQKVPLPLPDVPAILYANQDNDDLSQVFQSAIESAKESVLLVVYSLTDPGIIETLKEQSRRGVEVRVVCDAKASPYIDSKLGSKASVTRRFGPGLMHQKILVVDRQFAWIGSANMTTESLRLHGNLVSSFCNRELAEAICAKAETFDVESRGPPFRHQTFDFPGQSVELWFLPDNREASLKIKSMIRSAEKTLRIAMFTWTRDDFAKAVIAAQKRGVDTQVVIDHYQAKGVGEKVVKLLRENGVPVALSQGGPLLHHKFMFVDGMTLVNGSANWTRAAFTQNDDCFIIIHDMTEEQRNKMERLWDVIWKEAKR